MEKDTWPPERTGRRDTASSASDAETPLPAFRRSDRHRPQPPRGRARGSGGHWVALAAVIATVVLAVILGSVRGRPEPPEPSHTLSVWPDPASGDSTAFAVSPPRDPVSQQEWADVLGRLQEAAADPAADATDKRRLAIALYNLGRLDETEAIYRSLLETGEDAVVRNRLGNVLRDRGDLAGAEEAYREAIATDPSLPAPYINLAEMLWQLHRDDEAFALLDAADDAVSEAALPAIERTREALAGTSATTTT